MHITHGSGFQGLFNYYFLDFFGHFSDFQEGFHILRGPETYLAKEIWTISGTWGAQGPHTAATAPEHHCMNHPPQARWFPGCRAKYLCRFQPMPTLIWANTLLRTWCLNHLFTNKLWFYKSITNDSAFISSPWKKRYNLFSLIWTK